MSGTARDAMPPGFLGRLAMLAPIPANAAGALAVYLYFSYVDPLARAPGAGSASGLALFAAITGTLLAISAVLSDRWTAGVRAWARRLRAGASPESVPLAVRRRVLNAALMNGLLSLWGWFVAGLCYLILLRVAYRMGWMEPVRIFLSIVLEIGRAHV